MTRHVLAAAGVIAMMAAPTAHAQRLCPKPTMHQAATDFLVSLTPEQKKKTVYPFNSEERLNWHYIPKERMGLCFKEMTPEQQKSALTLLSVGLSQKGIDKVLSIRKLETVLREIEKGSGPVRDPDLYFFTVFGEPAAKGTWGWRYEGHHVS